MSIQSMNQIFTYMIGDWLEMRSGPDERLLLSMRYI